MTRLVIKTYAFTCDAPGCHASIDGLTGQREENSARAAWSEASAEGWTTGERDDEHRCPAHRTR